MEHNVFMWHCELAWGENGVEIIQRFGTRHEAEEYAHDNSIDSWEVREYCNGVIMGGYTSWGSEWCAK